MSQQIQITGGAKVRNLEGVLTGTAGVVNALGINVPSGIPQLDGSGKILVSQLPNSVMEYKGTWNAATNTPTLVNGTGNQGDVYLCNVAGTVNFGAGAITFAVGDQAIYSGTIWQKAGGSTGTVTSVAVTETGDALTITGSPITTSGTINIGFAGISGQYVNGAGGLTTFPTLISSIGLSMPSAFTVTNSPLTANGTIAVTGAGTTAQYIRGDGSLATFPTVANEAERLITEVYNDSGATLTKGTVVYINGGQGNLPTVAKALATGDATSAQTYGVVQTDITNMNNGFVVVIGSLTDLDTQAYANGTQLYLSSTVAGAWTSVKQYAPAHLVYVAIVTRSHPTQGVVEVRIQNGFEMDELHNVAAQSPSNGSLLQYVSSTSLWTAVAGTTTNIAEGTNLYFTDTRARNAISLTTTGTSGAATYSGGVLNIPNYGSALSGYVPYTGATNHLDLGENDLFTRSAIIKQLVKLEGFVSGSITNAAALAIKTSTQGFVYGGTGYVSITSNETNALTVVNESGLWSRISFNSISANRTFTFPNATGTIALTSDLSSYLPLTGGTLSGALNINLGSGTGLNVASDLVIFRASTGFATPRQITLAAGNGPTTYLEAKGYGGNYITDFGIRTYNASGTGFEVFFATSAGNVGINNTSPTSPLDIIANNSTAIHLRLRGRAADSVGQMEFWNNAQSTRYGYIATDSTSMGIVTTQDIPLVLGTNSAERMRITAVNVGIGTSSPTDFGTTYTVLCVDNTGNGGVLDLRKNGVRGLTLAVDGSVASIASRVDGQPIVFNANSGGTVSEKMRITSGGDILVGLTSSTYQTTNRRAIVANGTSTALYGLVVNNVNKGYFYSDGTNIILMSEDSAGHMLFGTNNAERMRITSGGDVLIGTTASANGKLRIETSGTNAIWVKQTSPGGYGFQMSAANNGGVYYFQNFMAVTTDVGSITSNGTTTTYAVTSDYRLKEDLKDFKGLDLVSLIKTYDYEWKSDKTRMYGVLAHELQEILPYAVTGEKDAEQMQGVDYSKIVPVLVKAIQELNERIKQLENK